MGIKNPQHQLENSCRWSSSHDLPSYGSDSGTTVHLSVYSLNKLIEFPGYVRHKDTPCEELRSNMFKVFRV